MAFFKNDGRQSPAVAVVKFSLDDFTDGTLDVVELPGNAIVTGGFITVTTAFDAGTTATLDLGTSTDADLYLDGGSVAAEGLVALVPTGDISTRVDDLTLTYAETGTAATEGEGVLVLEYIELGKSEWTQG